MLYASKEEKQLYGESCNRELILSFENGLILGNDSIYAESMELEQTLCDESELTFGKCSAACFRVRILDSAESYKGMKLIPEIKTGDFSRQLGVFWVESDSLTSDKRHRDIIAYDAMYKVLNTDVSDWYNAQPFPLDLKSFRKSFFEFFRITQEETVLPNDEMIIERTVDANKLCGADVIQSICELNACFGSIQEEGRFRYVFLKTYEDVLYPSDNIYPKDDLYPSDKLDCKLNRNSYKQGSLKYEDYKCRQITQLQIRQEENDIGLVIGETGNAYIIEDNFLVYGKGTEELTEIAKNFMTKAQCIPFQPASLECRGQPWVQVGDYVEAIGNRDVVMFPVLHRTMSGIIALMDVYEAKGEEYYGEKVNGITYDIKQLKGKTNVLVRTIEETKSTITDMEAGLQSRITQTAESITAEVTRASGVEKSIDGKIDAAQETLSSQIAQTAGSIISTVQATYETKGDASSNYTKLSSQIAQTADSISSKVSKGNIVSEINQSAESVKIAADKLMLEGEMHMTGGSIHIEAEESIRNIIELKRSGTKVQMGNDGMRATSDSRTATFQYSQIGIESDSGSGSLIAKLQDDGYGVSSFGWNSYSDRRLKNSIEPLEAERTSHFVYSLKPCRYKYNYDEKGIYRHGLIAQDVKEQMGEETWALYSEDIKLGEQTYLGLNYLELVADLIVTVQIQNERITMLESKMEELTGSAPQKQERSETYGETI